MATDPKLAEHYKTSGALFIAVGVDTVMLANGTTALAASVKGDSIELPPPSNGAY